jgi:uncharacterized repeat protein (TIGR03806 family)
MPIRCATWVCRLPPARGGVCWRVTLLTVLAVSTLACGGGGSGRGEAPTGSQDGFGLASRESRADLRLPGAPSSRTGVMVSEAFDGLSFEQPLFLAQVPAEDRLVVVEKIGRVLVFDRAAGTSQADVVLDLSERVITDSEQGLLGLAFDPGFADNRFIYVYYSVASDGPTDQQSVVARFRWDVPDAQVDPASEKVILEIPQPAENHNGGHIAFGPDGMLYIALGDGGGSGDPDDHGQNTGTLLGALLRIDVHPADDADGYEIPPDNPLVGVAGARPELWAYGLRNPWRFSFDRQSGTLWLADVGQSGLEEINLIEPGGNYGWRVWEGTRRFADSAHETDDAFRFPLFEYENVSGASITGGYVYRGTALPTLAGWYVYGDFVTGQVWALDHDGTGATANEQIGHVEQLSSFGEDAGGELYPISLLGGLHTLTAVDPGAAPPTPALLSETGLFLDTAALEPAAGVMEYAVVVPQWLDGALLRRWIALPDDAAIGFDAAGDWSFPTGTVLVQHVELPLGTEGPAVRQRLETRLMIRRSGDWQHFSYRWNDAGTDAGLLTGRATLPLSVQTPEGPEHFTYTFPAPTDCRQCHTAAAGTVLGVRTHQLNREFTFPLAADNQLRTWSHIGMFTRSIGATAPLDALPRLDDDTEPPARRARAWLHVNCASCHRPNGPTQLDLDLRFDTPAEQLNAIGAPRRSDGFGIDAELIIAPGDRAASMLWQRIRQVGSGRMPPLSSNRIDADGLALVGDWIDGL